MITKRAVGWVAFFGVAAALTWGPEYFMPADETDATVAIAATPAKSTTRGTLPAASASGKPAVIKDLSPSGDLFAARSWKATPTLATVTEQPVNQTPVVQVPSAPPMPFQFVGKLHDRSDLQVFLQSGEKIYVVRKGDVIDDTWRIEGISDVELSFVYLPLHLSQTLSVGSTQ
ncbi:hypothetical protein PSH58_11920 [Pseudomonas hefeiensis]|uniref:Secretion system X translation initiation factor n=1 Tax=Pseudomonas hefeiensis TaxID=2738125 RepID=A0ABY9GIL6_9PSED|nr:MULTISPECIES: hypothetical protein [unclassified Pseudomonas]WLH15472.1 hypothetical protein PSH57_11900 [Pseudomonas sp. FP205]WLH97992.1 hypothetical protein PSH58_11920 [Pseudomonas sp. FP53]WLI42779.1 hypothetical protein PSH74_11865 [Pseudomonas sp. FP821]